MKRLQVAALQMELAQKDIQRNIAQLHKLTEGATFDLLVLPEMWTTGFIVNTEKFSEEDLHQAYEEGVKTMKELAKAHDAAIYGSLIELLPNGKPANSGVFVTPTGEVTPYRKKHLFRPGGEAEKFEAGSERVQVNYHGWEIRLSTCYDLRFPVWLRQDREMGLYDILLCSANWPRPRHLAWERLLRARAIENQCYLIATNRTGTPHPKLQYPGYSFILNTEGDSLTESKEEEQILLTTTLSKEQLEERRQKFPVLKDLDPFHLT